MGVSGAIPETVPSVNEGEDDWNTCLARHVLSNLTGKRDRWNNVIGRQPLDPDLEEAMLQAMLTMLRQLPSLKEEASVPESTIRALCAAYQSEVHQLIDSGLLVPKYWRHYPPSEV